MFVLAVYAFFGNFTESWICCAGCAAATSKMGNPSNGPAIKKMFYVYIKQGSDLIEMRLRWREMEDFIFGWFLRIFGDILEEFWRFFEEFWRNWFIVRKELPWIGDQHRKWAFEATMTSKQPRRSNQKSDLKFRAKITYATMFVWTVLTLFFIFLEERRKKEDNSPLLELLCFAATKNIHLWPSRPYNGQNHLYSTW